MAFGRFGAAAGLFCRLVLANRRGHRDISLEERLAVLPIEGAPVSLPVTICWDDHQVPFIEAASDDDLAAALGIVHAHLRLGQMELMRRLAQGRVCEMVGRLGIGLDRLVRTFDIGRAVPQIIAAMPVETRLWLQAFVRGINHCLEHAPELPREFALLGLQREPWTLADIVLIGRLIAADVNWIVWLRLFKFRADPQWPRLWARLLRHDTLSFESAKSDGSDPATVLAGSVLRSGSNSLAVSAKRSASGGALMANDPHLSITLPNAWLLVAMKSPSHHALGLMVPGIPFIGLGRNPWIAWGGASLHAASSDLVSVPAHAELRERVETIRVRGEKDVHLPIRETSWGPIVSDLPAFRSPRETLALRWTGHQPSDEFTAMLGVGRARNWQDFRKALETYALPGLEMNFADISGNVGQLMAARLPRRQIAEPADMVSPPENGWEAPLDSSTLPFRFNPPEGSVASANARPEGNGPVVGFHFSPPDRLRRLRQLLGAEKLLGIDELMRMQGDVHLAEAVAQRDALVSWLRRTARAPSTGELIAALENWDGNYGASSKGALGFELLFFHLAQRLVTPARRAAYEAAWGTRALIWDDLLAAPEDLQSRALRVAARKAAADLRRGTDWGSRHRLSLAHPLGLVPLIGRRYRFANLPAAGTSESLMKTAHGLTNRRHSARYGSVARHISDLGDLDANYFALLGGQDGWFGSSNFADQVALWQNGEYIPLPLRPESARKSFRHLTVLSPGLRQ